MTKLTRRKFLHRKLLEIKVALGRREGLADNYRDLSNFYINCGDFDRAEEMYRKSLEIGEALGSKAGMADAYINLGILHQTRGDPPRPSCSLASYARGASHDNARFGCETAEGARSQRPFRQ